MIRGYSKMLQLRLRQHCNRAVVKVQGTNCRDVEKQLHRECHKAIVNTPTEDKENHIYRWHMLHHQSCKHTTRHTPQRIAKIKYPVTTSAKSRRDFFTDIVICNGRCNGSHLLQCRAKRGIPPASHYDDAVAHNRVKIPPASNE